MSGHRKRTRGTAAQAMLAAAVAALVLAAAGCGDRFPDLAQTGEFTRLVLIEEATGTWCTYCPEAADNLETLRASHPGEFVVLALHYQDDYSNAETDERLSAHGVNAFPTIIFDGAEECSRDVASLEKMLAERRELGASVKLELTASLGADSVLYEITVIVSEKLAEQGEAVLRTALVEDTVSDASVGLLHHVVRRLPKAGSDDQLTLEPADTLTLHRALKLDDSWGRPLRAVVWLESPERKVYQAASYELGGGSADEGDFSIELTSDTVLTIAQPGDDAFFYFNLKNHTGNDITLTVDLPQDLQGLPSGWFANICDTLSCYPMPSDFEIPANGSWDEMHLQIVSSGADTEGKAVMTVSAGTEVDTQAFILHIGQ